MHEAPIKEFYFSGPAPVAESAAMGEEASFGFGTFADDTADTGAVTLYYPIEYKNSWDLDGDGMWNGYHVKPITVQAKGTVMDYDTFQPIEGAAVTVTTNISSEVYTGTSDAEGKFTVDIPGKAPVTIEVEVEADGYQPGGTLRKNLAEGEAVAEWPMVRLQKPHTVKVTAVLPDGAAAAGYTINGTGLTDAPVTDSDGVAEFRLLSGSYRLAIETNAYYAYRNLTVNADTEVTLTLAEPEMEWWIEDGTLYITGCGPMPDYSLAPPVPWVYDRSRIKRINISGLTSITSGAFSDCQAVESVELSSSITSIGVGAFAYCKSLTSVTIPKNVTSIGNGAFYACSNLTEVYIPEGVTSIGNSAFYACSKLSEVILPESVTSIGRSAFYCCDNLEHITILNCNIKIEDYAFAGCTKLISVGKMGSGCNVQINFPVVIETGLFQRLPYLTSVIISDNVTTIGEQAFYNCNTLEEVIIPDSVDTIAGEAFYRCSALTKADLPENVASIGNKAFSGCTSLTETFIPKNVSSLADYVFSDCSNLAVVTIPESVTSIGVCAFSNCPTLTAVVIPAGVTSIGNAAFRYCSNLEHITLMNRNIAIENNAFDKCTKLLSVGELGSGCNIQMVFPDAIERASFQSFSYLTSITFPDNVTMIGERAFYIRNKLEKVIIPESVVSIGAFAFYGCTSLSEIDYQGTEEQWEKISKGSGWNENCPAVVYFDS